jgi:hypothetical protein
MDRKLVTQAGQERIEWESGDTRKNGPCLKLVDVKNRIEHFGNRIERVAAPLQQIEYIDVIRLLFENPSKQAKGLERLAKVMAGGGEKAGFGEIGSFGFFLGFHELLFSVISFRDVLDRDKNASFACWLFADLAGV